MQEPAGAGADHVRFRVRRGADGLVYGEWARIRGADGASLGASDGARPVAEAWEEVKDHAAAHDLALVHLDDPDCVFDAERLGLARPPGHDCAARG